MGEKEIFESLREKNFSLFEKTVLKIKNIGERVIHN
jgi:hypothetical protein